MQDIVVIGASAGGHPALVEIARGLPADFPAAVFVVIHVSAHHRSVLPEILGRAGPLPASHAVHGAPIQPGHIYVAPPDHHLLLRPGVMELSRTARENRTRPAIDPLFRSAAAAYGDRVVGVILSGTLGDGTVGLMAIKDQGGYAVVQDPDEVMFSGMPLRAIEFADVDQVLPVREIAPCLVRLARPEISPEKGTAMATDSDDLEAVIREDLAEQAEGMRGGETATYSCPECGGVLWQLHKGKVMQFRCHVGHTYSPELLLMEKSESLEWALWAAVRTLVEKATLTRQLAARLEASGQAERAAAIREQAELDERHIAVIRESILGASPNPVTQGYVVAHAVEEAVDESLERRSREG